MSARGSRNSFNQDDGGLLDRIDAAMAGLRQKLTEAANAAPAAEEGSTDLVGSFTDGDAFRPTSAGNDAGAARQEESSGQSCDAPADLDAQSESQHIETGHFDEVIKPNGHDACCACSACCEAAGDREFPQDDAGQPWADGTAADPDQSGNDVPFFTSDQVADQLTFGYWNATSGGGQRSFDVAPGDSLNVDISGLQANGMALAREALDAWTAVTGIYFIEVEALPTPSSWTDEGGDAASGTGTFFSISVGEGFRGTLATGADRDAVAVELVAGQSYTIALRGDGSAGNPLFDPYLRVLSSSGSVVAQNDDAESYDSRLTFTAAYTGTHYLQAGSYADSYSGDYSLQISGASGPVHITFGDQASGAYAQSQTFGSTILSSFVNVNWNWTGGENRIDGYHYQTYLHEIGHALGLGHAGNYNGAASFGTDNHYANDSWAVSLMSYFHQTENSFTSSSFAYAITPMMADILAIQNLYGTPEFAAGDTTYGRGGNGGTYLDSALDFTAPTAWTVFDTGGVDHFDFSDFVQDQRLDLRDEAWSDLAGLVENIAIMRGTVIENGTTGTGNDTLTGNAVDNALWADLGDDLVSAGAGNDAVFGGGGADELLGGAGLDLLEGGDGSDLLRGGDDGDLLFGDGVTLAELEALFPDWDAPDNAQARIDAGEVHILWDDILLDVFAVA